MDNKIKIYDIFPKRNEIKRYRKEYFDSLEDEKSVCKLESSTDEWYNYRNGIYVLNDGEIFQSQYVSKTILCSSLINEYIRNGLNSDFKIFAVNYKGRILHYLTWRDVKHFNGNYFVSQAFPIDDTLYNIEMISSGKYLNIDIEGLGDYSLYFDVSEQPYDYVDVDSIRFMLFKGEIDQVKACKIVSNAKNHESVVRVLKK